MAEEGVLKYLTSTNRPYSANDIVLNLHKQWGKTGVQRALDSLVQEGKVLEKTYGKQKVYVIKQNDVDLVDDDMKAIDDGIAQGSATLKETESHLKEAENQLKSLTSSMSTEEAVKMIDEVQIEVNQLKIKLDKLSKNSVPISPEKIKQAQGDFTKAVKEYRKRICMDIVNTVLEGYPKKKEELIEELGLDMDESVGFVLPQI